MVRAIGAKRDRLIGRRLGVLVFRIFSSHVGEGIIFRNIDFRCHIVKLSICYTQDSAVTSHVLCSGSDKFKWTQTERKPMADF